MDEPGITVVPVANPVTTELRDLELEPIKALGPRLAADRDEGALSCTHDADGRKVCVRRAPGRPPRDLSSR